ncbi:MAG: c-type cytochrome [Myxococcales bacterium]|nr:c-type cytochrome [Myxococcales bacterium]
MNRSAKLLLSVGSTRSPGRRNDPQPACRRPTLPFSVGAIALLLLTSVTAACTGDEVAPEPAVDTSHLPGGDTTNTILLGVNAYSRHADNITPEHEGWFFTGNSLFDSPWVQAPSSTTARDGLGPLFNARSCGGCHFNDGRGRPLNNDGTTSQGLLFRLSVGENDETGAPIDDPSYGGQFQPQAISGVAAEGSVTITYTALTRTYPDGSNYELQLPSYEFSDLAYGDFDDELRFSPRVAPPMIGLGLLEAIPEERLDQLADPDDTDGDGISGRLQLTLNADSGMLEVGRFGWKAEQPTVRLQTAGAFNGDLGITSSVFSVEGCSPVQLDCQQVPSGGAPEIDDNLLDLVAAYSALVAPPIRTDAAVPEVLAGRALFADVGCASCHVPSHQTGEHPEFIELSNQIIWPYTDLLLHDMGPELADDRPVFQASGQEWRTPPLWGLSQLEAVSGHTQLLHDGRARNVEEAIMWHGGEAETSRNAFAALSEEDRAALLRFVQSL